jgi:hypothetical protein
MENYLSDVHRPDVSGLMSAPQCRAMMELSLFAHVIGEFDPAQAQAIRHRYLLSAAGDDWLIPSIRICRGAGIARFSAVSIEPDQDHN